MAAIVDVFVYLVVLDLFVQYVPQVISETFALSLLTALLLKAVLEIILLVKNLVKKGFHRAATLPGKAVAALGLWAIVIGSKFFVLEAVALAFSDRVKLGGYFAVTGLIFVLLAARAGVRLVLRRRGRGRGGKSPPPAPKTTEPATGSKPA
jgi:hypothetical protein